MVTSMWVLGITFSSKQCATSAGAAYTSGIRILPGKHNAAPSLLTLPCTATPEPVCGFWDSLCDAAAWKNFPCCAHVWYVFFCHVEWESSGNLVGIRLASEGIRWESGGHPVGIRASFLGIRDFGAASGCSIYHTGVVRQSAQVTFL